MTTDTKPTGLANGHQISAGLRDLVRTARHSTNAPQREALVQSLNQAADSCVAREEHLSSRIDEMVECIQLLFHVIHDSGGVERVHDGPDVCVLESFNKEDLAKAYEVAADILGEDMKLQSNLYYVEMYEVHRVTYEVEAVNEQDALDLAREGQQAELRSEHYEFCPHHKHMNNAKKRA